MIDVGDDLTLVAPGAAFVRHARALVIADLHAGHVATLRQRGHALPPLGDDALHARVDGLLAALDPAHVVVAGDLVHGGAAAVSRTRDASPLDQLLARMAGRRVTVVPGNHDRAVTADLARRDVEVSTELRLGPHVVRHGDEDPALLRALREEAAARGGYALVGHLHPALTLRGAPGVRARVPAFAWCAGWLALPALSPLARGADLLREDYAAEMLAVVRAEELRTAVVIGSRVVETGTLARVRAAR